MFGLKSQRNFVDISALKRLTKHIYKTVYVHT